MSLTPGTPIGKYVVRRKLAEGGMAEIYLATVKGPEGFEKEVVIKRIRSFLASDEGFVKMFIAEARLASRLNHLNIVQIFDFDRHDDTYYLAMEYVRGVSLWEIRKRSKELMTPMPSTLAAQICAEVARALHYAHRLTEKGKPLGLVHRDVTPQNVLISFDGAVKLADFGIAKAGNKLTSPGMLKGKFAYMSPEQARGEDVDARTDTFALGIVLWEMLTGGRLFDGDTDVAVLRAVQESAIVPPARLNPDVPQALDEIVVKALQRDVTKRFQTAGEMERALAQFVLTHARSVDDTDIAGFVRKLFDDALAAPGSEGEGTEPSAESFAPSVASERSQSKPRTAVMRRQSREAPASPPSPDEDYEAQTYVTGRKAAFDKTQAQRPAPAPVEPALAPAPVPAPRPAIGMREGALIGAALLLVIGGAAIVLAMVNRTEPLAPSELAVAERVERADAATATLPVADASPDAATVPIAATAEPVPDAGQANDAIERPAAEPGNVGTGKLVVRAVPWAALIVDKRHRGEVTDHRVITLEAGEHEIVLVHPSKTRRYTVKIAPGEQESISFSIYK